MDRISERFSRYVTIDTVSKGEVEAVPSTDTQWVLARLLVQELQDMGLTDAFVNEYCTVYAHLPATEGYEQAPTLGFIAHMDTVPGGHEVVPHFIENYDGGDVTLANGSVIRVSDHPHLPSLKGRTLIVSGGDTILGADDKAGVTAIMELCSLLTSEGHPHGRIAIAFTPDEEVGTGVLKFDTEAFEARFAFTVDGGAENEIEAETFNAATAKVHAKGFQAHPGSAKGIMKNAISALCRFQCMLPGAEVPECTEGREGFFHLIGMEGDVSHATATYIIRDFDRASFENRKQIMQTCATAINQEMGQEVVSVTITDSYRNMAEIVQQHPHLLQSMDEAIRSIGLTPVDVPVRGGTDGARLCFMGVPCPNLGAGGYAFHSFKEHCTVEGIENSVKILLKLVDIYREK